MNKKIIIIAFVGMLLAEFMSKIGIYYTHVPFSFFLFKPEKLPSVGLAMCDIALMIRSLCITYAALLYARRDHNEVALLFEIVFLYLMLECMLYFVNYNCDGLIAVYVATLVLGYIKLSKFKKERRNAIS